MFSFLRDKVTSTTIFDRFATPVLKSSCVDWIELLIASKIGCIASVVFRGFGKRSIRFTKFIDNDGILRLIPQQTKDVNLSANPSDSSNGCNFALAGQA